MSETSATPVIVLARALDQTGDLLGVVREQDLDLPTPCRQWSVGRLADHLVSAPGRFQQMMRGEEPDWSAEPARVQDDWAGRFRIAADDLIHLWHEQGSSGMADWQTAEFAVHGWDLARALGRPTDRLDPEVARRGLAFMRANLTAENRGGAFGPERTARPDAGPYEQLAAFAGREV